VTWIARSSYYSADKEHPHSLNFIIARHSYESLARVFKQLRLKHERSISPEKPPSFSISTTSTILVV
jgi:hypothetical protein